MLSRETRTRLQQELLDEIDREVLSWLTTTRSPSTIWIGQQDLQYAEKALSQLNDTATHRTLAKQLVAAELKLSLVDEDWSPEDRWKVDRIAKDLVLAVDVQKAPKSRLLQSLANFHYGFQAFVQELQDQQKSTQFEELAAELFDSLRSTPLSSEQAAKIRKVLQGRQSDVDMLVKYNDLMQLRQDVETATAAAEDVITCTDGTGQEISLQQAVRLFASSDVFSHLHQKQQLLTSANLVSAIQSLSVCQPFATHTDLDSLLAELGLVQESNTLQLNTLEYNPSSFSHLNFGGSELSICLADIFHKSYNISLVSEPEFERIKTWISAAASLRQLGSDGEALYRQTLTCVTHQKQCSSIGHMM